MTYAPRWQPQPDGSTLHREGWVLTPSKLDGHEHVTTLVAPDGELVGELRRNGSGQWRHPSLTEAHRGGFATAQTAADDLIDWVTYRGIYADDRDVHRREGEGGRHGA